MGRSLGIFLVLALWLGPGLPCPPAQADQWKTPHLRRTYFSKLADKTGLARASQKAVDALNKAYGLTLTPDQVRITSYTGERKFWSFVDKAKKSALGMAVTPHRKGPHPHLVVGDHVFDGIQPGWTNADGKKATFRDGTLMRKDQMGTPHQGSSRLFCLFKAPGKAVQTATKEAETLLSTRRDVGFNCARLVTERLAGQGKGTSDSPFAQMLPTGNPGMAVDRVMKAQPDIIIQVLPEADYHKAMKDPHHLVKFWGEQALEH